MTNLPAGSKQRANINGHTVVTTPALIRSLRRLSAMGLSQIFLQAGEHGSAPIVLDEQTWMLIRHSDHTFTVEAEVDRPTL